ncbi:MAG TPA: TonB-dependent receptor [Pyrinomonadaceae bacterium]|jgi:iron complex outermembrane receptor protein
MSHIKKLLSLTALLFVFSTAIFAQTNGKISGKVFYGDNNSPMGGATVQIVQLKQTVVTDENGAYEFANIPAGRYTITAHQEGFGDTSKTVDLAAGAALAAIDFQIQIAGFKEQVTVTASGTEQSTFEAIQTTSTVDATSILERPGVGLGDAVGNQAGVTNRTNGAGNSRPVIRGFDGDRVKITTDGVSVGSLASQSGDHAEPVDVLAVERIEVVKGPATLLYGSNAIGGVVNAISGHDENAQKGLRGYFSALGSTNSNQASVSGGGEYGVGKWMFWSNGSGARSGDYSAGGDFGKVRNTFTRSADGTGGLGFYDKKFFANGTYSFYQSRYGIPFDFHDPGSELRSLRVWRGDFRFNGGFRDLDSFVTGVKVTLDASNYRHQELADGEVGTTFRNRVSSYRTIFDQKKYGKLTGRFGFEGFQRKFQTVGTEVLIPGLVTQKSFSVFGLEEITLDRFTFQFGARVENNRYRPTDTSLIKRDFTGLSGALGMRAKLWKTGAFVANYSHGYRTPALEELYNNGPHDGSLSFEIGNPNLKAEISDGLDLSLRQQSNRLRGEINFYYYDLKNYVFLAPTGNIDAGSGFPIARYLQGDSRYFGTEATIDYTAHKYLNLVGGVDYVNAKLKSGLNLPRIPPFRARLGLDFHYKELSVRPEWVLTAGQDKVFTNETPTSGYGVVNLAGTYIIPAKRYTNIFTVNAFNLTNQLYFNHLSFIKDISPGIGRGVRFSYTVRFF